MIFINDILYFLRIEQTISFKIFLRLTNLFQLLEQLLYVTFYIRYTYSTLFTISQYYGFLVLTLLTCVDTDCYYHASYYAYSAARVQKTIYVSFCWRFTYNNIPQRSTKSKHNSLHCYKLLIIRGVLNYYLKITGTTETVPKK